LTCPIVFPAAMAEINNNNNNNYPSQEIAPLIVNAERTSDPI
jgi:hypothetical protein